jgi:capsular polysaccharide biosynthesis protein
MTILYDGCVSRRTPPHNLRPEDAPLFAHELERTIDPMHALELANVSANGEGLLFRRGRILGESFAVAEIYERARRRRLPFLVRNYLLRRRRKLPGRFLWITDDWSNGYFHWLADALPRLFAARELATTMTLILPAKCDLDFVRASLRLFDVGGIEYIAPHEVRVVDQLILPSHAAPSGSFNDPLMRELRSFILDSCGVDTKPHRRIYISRSRATKRRIANEEEVIAVLRDFDFEVVHFEDHSFEEQVRIAAATKLMVANHGAGLTNMLFMPAGGQILELRRAGERERNCFFNLATTARLDYYYQSCPQERAEESPHSANVVVDVGELRKNLELGP